MSPPRADFQLTPDDVGLLCFMARRGLSASSAEADPKVMAKAWDALSALAAYFVEKKEPAAHDVPTHQ